MSAWKERAWEKGSMTNRDWGEWGGIHGRGIKFSRHWERHCDGHKPPDLLLGVCAQLRWCRRRKPPDKTWPDWMQDLDVSRATWGAAAGAGLLHSKKQQPRLGWMLETPTYSARERQASSHLVIYINPFPVLPWQMGGMSMVEPHELLGRGVLVGALHEPSSITSGVPLSLLGFMLPGRSWKAGCKTQKVSN